METKKIEHAASKAQLKYIESLQEQLGLANMASVNLSRPEAPRIIGELVALSTQNKNDGTTKREVTMVNHARLGLAMKECFRLYTRNGRDVWNEKRNSFIQNTVETYKLFSEIADIVKTISVRAQITSENSD